MQTQRLVVLDQLARDPPSDRDRFLPPTGASKTRTASRPDATRRVKRAPETPPRGWARATQMNARSVGSERGANAATADVS